MRKLAAVAGMIAGLTLVSPLAAQEKPDANLLGKWELTYETQRGTTTWQLNFAMKDGALAGTATNQRGDSPISKVTVKGEDVAFTITVTFNDNSFEQNFTGKVTGDAGEGTVAMMGRRGGGGQTINWKLKRTM